MAGDSFLTVYKEMVGIKENAPDCVPMPPDMLAQYLASVITNATTISENATTTFNQTAEVNNSSSSSNSSSSTCSLDPDSPDSSCAANAAATGAFDVNLVNNNNNNNNNNNGTIASDNNNTTVVSSDVTTDDNDENEAADDDSDPLVALKRQLADQQKLVHRMLASLQQGGILPSPEEDDEMARALAHMQVTDQSNQSPRNPLGCLSLTVVSNSIPLSNLALVLLQLNETTASGNTTSLTNTTSTNTIIGGTNGSVAGSALSRDSLLFDQMTYHASPR